MAGEGGYGVSRRTALKLAGGTFAAAGGVGTAAASTTASTDCGPPDTPQYLVHAVLVTEKPATGLRTYVSKAVAQLNQQLSIETDLRYERRAATAESLGLTPEMLHPSADQVQTFDTVRENLPDSDFLAAVKSDIDADVSMDDLYFLFVHNNGSLSMSGDWGPQGKLSGAASLPGWGQSNPVEHDVVDGETLDMILFGPTGGLDNAGIAEEVAGYGEWRERVLSYQAVGHALGAHHHHGGYRVDDKSETIEEVSVMAAGHVLDRRGQYDIEESLDNWPWAPAQYLAKTENGRLRTTDNGCLILRREPGAEEHVSCAYLDYRFGGWGGGTFPELDAELPLDRLSDDEEARRDLEGIHPTEYTDAAKAAIVGSLKRRGLSVTGDRKIDPGADIPDPVALGPGEPLRLDASPTNINADTEATVYEWRVWPQGRPLGEENGFDNVIHAYGETAQVSYEELERHFLDDGEEIVVQLNVFAVPSGEAVGGGADSSIIDRLRGLVERDTEPGGVKEIPDPACRTDEWESVLFNRTQVGPVATTTESGPEPAFSIDPGEPVTGGEVTFDASSTTNPGGGAIVSYHWTAVGPKPPFPPGVDDRAASEPVAIEGSTAGLAETAEATFEEPGTYEVTLSVTNQTGVSRETTERFTVRPRGTLSGQIVGPDGLAPGENGEYEVDVTAAKDRTDDYFTYDWSLRQLSDDGAGPVVKTDEGPSFTVAPDRTGRYELSVAVRELREVTVPTGAGSEGGATIAVDDEELLTEATAELSRTVVVNEPPAVEVRADREQIPPGSTATFTAAVTNADPGDEYDYTWFGGASVAGTSREISTQFDEVGDRTVAVTVTDRFGRTGTDTLTVEVEDPAEVPDVTIYGPDTPEAYEAAIYTARVSGGEGDLTYSWNVGGSGPVIDTTFDEVGERTVAVTVTDERGYDVTERKTVTVEDHDEVPANALQGPSDESPSVSGLVAEQGGTVYDIQPLTRDESIESFYSHGESGGFSVNTSTGIARTDVSELFVYEGPNGPSLVLIQGRRGSGSATFEFSGVPDAASWAVTDDAIGSPTDSYDGTSRVEWDWSPNRSDGGALRGGFDGPFAVTIDPTFEYGISEWQLLSGRTDDASNPERTTLSMSEPVTIRRGTGTDGA